LRRHHAAEVLEPPEVAMISLVLDAARNGLDVVETRVATRT